jgi:hypothetical protein
MLPELEVPHHTPTRSRKPRSFVDRGVSGWVGDYTFDATNARAAAATPLPQ